VGKKLQVRSRGTGALVSTIDLNNYEYEVVDDRIYVGVKYTGETGEPCTSQYTYDTDGFMLSLGELVLVPAGGKLMAARVTETNIDPPFGVSIKKIVAPLDEVECYL
jgi:hypothetical protein